MSFRDQCQWLCRDGLPNRPLEYYQAGRTKPKLVYNTKMWKMEDVSWKVHSFWRAFISIRLSGLMNKFELAHERTVQKSWDHRRAHFVSFRLQVVVAQRLLGEYKPGLLAAASSRPIAGFQLAFLGLPRLWLVRDIFRSLFQKKELPLFRITKVSDRGSGAKGLVIMQIKMKVFRPCSAELLDN